MSYFIQIINRAYKKWNTMFLAINNSLVGPLGIGLLVFGLVSFVLIKQISRLSTTFEILDTNSDLHYLHQHVTNILKNKIACKNTFGSLHSTHGNTTFENLKNSTDKSIYSNSDNLFNQTVRISKIFVKGWKFYPNQKKSAVATLHMEFELKSKFLENQIISKKIPIRFEFMSDIKLGSRLILKNCYAISPRYGLPLKQALSNSQNSPKLNAWNGG